MHRYEVELTRRVGPCWYENKCLKKSFPFGKGKKFKTGKEAEIAATSFAKNFVDESTKIMIWKMNGGVGRGFSMKQTNELFPNDFSAEVLAQFNKD